MTFTLVNSWSCPEWDPNLQVEAYKEQSSGLNVVFSRLPTNPLFQVGIVVPTLANDHGGLPHTLEHLIFLGSTTHPTKGFLDKLATAAVADGTNAYTAEDHTCYTVCTASADGLVAIVPVFLEHVLYPVLDDAHFASEVYYGIQKDANSANDALCGKEGGVVFSEMLARQWTDSDQQDLLLRTSLGELHKSLKHYGWECGGRTDVIRRLKMDDIRKYHKYWYHPERVVIFVGGPIDSINRDEVLRGVENIQSQHETQIRKENSEPTFPHLEIQEADQLHAIIEQKSTQSYVCKKAEFPAEDESFGSVSFIHPIIKNNNESGEDRLKTLLAWEVLAGYLKDTSASPLSHYFTQRPDHVISTNVDMDVKWWHPDGALILQFSGVENIRNALNDDDDDNDREQKEDYLRFGRVRDELFEFIDNHEIEMSRMADALKATVLDTLKSLECSPHELVMDHMLPSWLSSHENLMEASGNDLVRYPKVLKDLQEMPQTFWQSMLISLKTMPCGEVIMVPSRDLAQKQIKSSSRLSDNSGHSDHPLTKRTNVTLEVVTFALPKTLSSIDSKQVILAAGKGIKQATFTGSCHSVTLNDSSRLEHVLMAVSLRDLPKDLLPFLNLFQQCLFELDIDHDGLVMPYEKLQAFLTANAVEWEGSVGMDSSLFALGYLEDWFVMKCSFAPRLSELDPERTLKLLKSVLCCGKPLPERIEPIMEQLQSDTTDAKRSPGLLMESLRIASLKRQSDLMKEKDGGFNLLDLFDACRLKDGKTGLKKSSHHALKKILELHQYFEAQVAAGNWFVQIIGGDGCFLRDIPAHFMQWKQLNVPRLGPHLNSSHSILLQAPGITASYLSVSAPLLDLNFSEKTEAALKDFVSLSLACTLMSMLEGPLYQSIRGAGIAYHASIHFSLWRGLVTFSVGEASDVPAAFRAFRSCLSAMNTWLNEDSLLLSKRAFLFAMVAERSNPASIANVILRDALRGLPEGWEALIDTITVDKVKDSVKKYINPIMQSDRRLIICLCPPGMGNDLAEQFLEEHDIEMQVYNDLP